MNIQRIYKEFKTNTFSKGYAIFTPSAFAGHSNEYHALVIPPYIERSEYVITYDGQIVPHEFVNTDFYRQILNRLDIDDAAGFEIKFSLKRKSTNCILRCFDTLNNSQIGAEVYIQGVNTDIKRLESSMDGMIRTTRINSEDNFWHSGFDDYNKLLNIYDFKSINSKTPKILDWGVGMGRVANYFYHDSSFEIFGADIDPVNIYQLHNQGYDPHKFKLMKPNGPLPFEDNFFDACYGISVFTHLNEDLQNYYLKELVRILKPGGVGIFSIHGFIHFFTRINDGNVFSKWIDKGFLKLSTNADINIGSSNELTADMYVDVLHTFLYIKNNWSRHFRSIRFVEAPNNYGHDLVVVTK